MTWERRILAAFASLLVPGSGQALLGRWQRGALFAGIAIGGALVSPFLGMPLLGLAALAWLVALVDTFFVPGEGLHLGAFAVVFGAGMGAVITAQAFVVRPIAIQASDMGGMLLEGDIVVVDRVSSFFMPSRGDVVVYRDPLDRTHEIAKRVVGLPGDKIEVQGATLYINHEAVAQRIVDGDINEETLDGHRYLVFHDPRAPARNFPGPEDEKPYVVPKDRVFVLGDSRDESKDSRFSGAVPLEDVRGRARWVLWGKDLSRFGARIR